jgi:opacity protein-like surface antigen
MAVIALALVAGGAQAQEAGWDTKMGVLFGIGVDGQPLDNYDGRVGFQYNLNPQAALRLGLNLNRFACGDITTTAGSLEITSVCNADPADPIGTGVNSALDIGISAEYLMRSSTAAVSPYFGAGVTLDIGTASLKGDAKTNDAADPVTKYNNKYSSLGFGLLGKAGVEWRLNKVIAVFAEYQLKIDIYKSNKATLDVKETLAGTGTVLADGEQKSSDIFNFSTGVANNGFVGIAAFF